MMPADLVLGYDFGTTALKAALFSADGTMQGCASASYPLTFPRTGHAEQAPADWWRAMVFTTRTLLGKVRGARERIAAIGIGAQMCGSVPVDGRGEPLHPCLIWLDTRSAGIARRITAGGPRIGGYGVFRLVGWLRLANGAPNLSGKDPLSKMLWFREAKPEVWARTARLLDVKDWLLHRCTGRFVTTPDVAQLTWLMDNRPGRRDWADAYLARFGIAREWLPQIVDAGAVAGVLTPCAAAELGLRPGLPVAAGAGDVNAAALAAGEYDEGAYHLSLGTGASVAAYSRTRRVDPFHGIGTLCAAHPDRYLLVAAQETAGAAVRWAASALAFGEGEAGLQALDSAAANVVPDDDTPLFMPWLYGERVPVDERHLRGALAGATLRTQRADLAYGVLSGVALNVRWALAHAERCVAPSKNALVVAGGGGRSAVWLRVLADMLQRPLVPVDAPAFGGARGAAMTAATAAGWFRSLVDAAGMARFGPVVEPDAVRRTWAESRYDELVTYWRATRRWHRERRTTDA